MPEETSAGGVVVRLEGGRVYVALAREGHWPRYVLPKGRVAPGESLEEAARREVAEETGLTDLTLVGLLGAEERLSFDRSRWKTTHYFLFRTTQREAIPADAARHPTFGGWFPLDDLPEMLWPEQRALLETHRDRLEAAARG